jgi:hypothetical protein
MDIVNKLEDATEGYEECMSVAAGLEADYKYLAAATRVKLADETTDRKVTAAEREARIELETEQHFRNWKLADAERHSRKEHLLSLRSILDAYRTISANVRAQT